MAEFLQRRARKFTGIDHGLALGQSTRYRTVLYKSHKWYRVLQRFRRHLREIEGNKNVLQAVGERQDEIELPSGDTLVLIGNHFKSKRNGNNQESRDRRQRQATRAAQIYVAARKRSSITVVAGDFNDTPDSPALQPLLDLQPATDKLRDVMANQNYDGLPGTFGTGLQSGKFDYILLPPEFWEKVHQVEVERRGTYDPRKWTPYDTVTSEENQASDHACVWVDLNL